ncbi:MAG TPA: imidazoleglycerol-phosphate dehydratase [bacterium]|nr:imidazoleglycerol-phosphate dehydratase [bacterium]
MKIRKSKVSRETRETRIEVAVRLDGPAHVKVGTGLPFFDHMLQAFACHGRFGLKLKATGDLHVDPHHLVEDCGIVIGQAMSKALGGYGGIARAGCFGFPMDESLASVAIDLCGRVNFVWKVRLGGDPIGGMDPRLMREFVKGIAQGLSATVHVAVLWKDNDHHACEAISKALGRALRMAVEPVGGRRAMSTKGRIDA